MQLNYSRGVPFILTTIKNFIYEFYLFADGFSQSSNEIDDVLKKTLESIIVQCLNGVLSRIIGRCDISSIAQIIRNLNYLSKSTEWFEEIITEKRYCL
jgi:hypothetical protein